MHAIWRNGEIHVTCECKYWAGILLSDFFLLILRQKFAVFSGNLDYSFSSMLIYNARVLLSVRNVTFGSEGLQTLCYLFNGHIKKTKLHGLSPLANYTDRPTVACRRSDCQLWRIGVPRGQRDGSLRSYSRFYRQDPLLFYQVAPQLYSRGWVDPFSDPLLFFFLVVPGIEPGPPNLYSMVIYLVSIPIFMYAYNIWDSKFSRRIS
jgi:hypothetical protein